MGTYINDVQFSGGKGGESGVKQNRTWGVGQKQDIIYVRSLFQIRITSIFSSNILLINASKNYIRQNHETLQQILSKTIDHIPILNNPNFLSQPKNLTAFSASSKTFVPAQKPILLNANHLFVWRKMFGMCKQKDKALDLILRSNFKFKRKIFFNFVAFSEYVSELYVQKKYQSPIAALQPVTQRTRFNTYQVQGRQLRII